MKKQNFKYVFVTMQDFFNLFTSFLNTICKESLETSETLQIYFI